MHPVYEPNFNDDDRSVVRLTFADLRVIASRNQADSLLSVRTASDAGELLNDARWITIRPSASPSPGERQARGA